MRKAYLVTACAIVLVLLALPAFAAENLDNVFIAGLQAGFYGSIGWLGENYDPGVGFGVFFGYGITEYFSMELDFYPMMMTAPSGDDVTDKTGLLEYPFSAEQSSASWGGFGNGSLGGWGVTGRLYPRKTFREADFKVVQPYVALGLTYIPLTWEYANADTVTANKYDGVNSLMLDVGTGVDFYIVEFVSLGPAVGIHKPFMMGDKTRQGEDLATDYKADFEGSLLWNASAVLKFQW